MPSACLAISDRLSSVAASDVRATRLQVGDVWIWHQPLGPVALDFEGDKTVVLIALDVESSEPGMGACARGAFLLLRPGRPARIDSADAMELLVLAFSDPGDIDLAGIDSGKLRRTADPGVRLLAQEIRRALHKEGAESSAFIESLAYPVLVRVAQLLAAKPKAARAAISPFLVRRIAGYIRENLRDPIRVDELASLAGLSRAHFSRAFADTTGETPHQFIVARRLDFVRERISAGDSDLSLIAASAGFSSHAHMTVAFRQAYGMTPSAFRDLRFSTPLKAQASGGARMHA
jgi:AraC-like DNA-binding protein